ncbi:MAG: 16S rRNA (guanine(527)-N(7))-methyltransferase RsmG [Lachnospiraceae bacterium]|jgi:16S rRNA (guanine527-N7)-methyltransferase|nr:16S rRNA (guanine(527)-N(7))-methyltransferase RsmG [Lachnospiraceae bacterium]RKI85462.1 16S rRNA (guanine(527)-N(7))-methyltransferase RsmG [bacterium 1xD42-87]
MILKEKNLLQFEKDLDELHISLSDVQLDQFLTYYEMLVEKNKVMNLTAITEFDEVMKKHFVDSLSLVKVCDLSGSFSVIDVGTGAGFPGIPLKIAFPYLKLTLLDSLNKRVGFLQEVIEKLGLQNAEAVHGRAEDFAKPGKLRESYDLCVSRAVANLSVLSEYCLPYVKVGGKFISYKSDKINIESEGNRTEIEEAEHAISVLGGKLAEQKEFMLPSSDIYRNLVVIEKNRPTPKQYPRKAGTASKKPIVTKM